MVFGLFRKTDPICGMKQEKDKGFIDDKTGKWFCSHNCREEYHRQMAKQQKDRERHGGGCCGH